MPTNAQIYLAFDFGMKHIGIAVGQKETQTATPLQAVPATNGIPNWETILSLLEAWDAYACVVGVPLTMDGESQYITHCAKKFANRLHEKSRLPVFQADERFTSIEAERHLRQYQLDDNIHAYSAKLILESWFRSNNDQ